MVAIIDVIPKDDIQPVLSTNCVPVTFQCFECMIIVYPAYELGSMKSLILQKIKLRLKEVKYLAQGDVAGRARAESELLPVAVDCFFDGLWCLPVRWRYRTVAGDDDANRC